MFILAVVGSPRKAGNTDVLVDRALEGARSSRVEVEKVYLADVAINPCKACDGCKKAGRCVQTDDMQALYPKILRAYGIIIGTPVYWWGPSAQTKLFVDRWYGLDYTRMKGKKMAVISPHEDDDPTTAEHVFGSFKRAADYLGIELVGTLWVSAGAKGGAASNQDAMNRALEIGKAVAAG